MLVWHSPEEAAAVLWAVARLGDLIVESRLERANRHGELTGMLRVAERMRP